MFDKLFELNYKDGKEDFKNRHLWVKKATGLGITEFVLRVMAWLCVRSKSYKNSQMCIITGPNIDIAISLIERIKRLFEPVGIYIENKETELELNGVQISAYPSNHLSTYRGLKSPKFIFLDEGDFFKKSDIQDVRDTTERYIAKSKPYIVMVSTPNKPDLLFQMIEEESDDKCIYHRFFFNYNWGIGKMFTQEEIDAQKQSPAFPREYDLQYAGLVGNLFSQGSIDRITTQYNPLEFRRHTEKYITVDQGFSTSKFAILIAEYDPRINKVRILLAEENDMPTYEQMIDRILRYRIQFGNVMNIGVDATSRIEFAMSLKQRIGESHRWSYVKERMQTAQKKSLDLARMMHIVPIIFSAESKAVMSSHAKRIVEDPKQRIVIASKFKSLLSGLKSAIVDDRGILDKEITIHNDLVDTFMMMCTFFHYKDEK